MDGCVRRSIAAGGQRSIGEDVALDAMVEKKCGWKEVRAVEASNGERDDIVESCVRANVDQCQEAGEGGDDADSDDGDFGASVDFADDGREWCSLVAGEGPSHS